jgi:hypothetical protein
VFASFGLAEAVDAGSGLTLGFSGERRAEEIAGASPEALQEDGCVVEVMNADDLDGRLAAGDDPDDFERGIEIRGEVNDDDFGLDLAEADFEGGGLGIAPEVGKKLEDARFAEGLADLGPEILVGTDQERA